MSDASLIGWEVWWLSWAVIMLEIVAILPMPPSLEIALRDYELLMGGVYD